MNQKHLLEMAAKAAGKDLAGYQWVDTPMYTGFEQLNQCPETFELLQAQYWNPLVDNSDAFALMVDLGIQVEFSSDDVTSWQRHVGYISEDFGQDKRATSRLAIVRAAAAIGEAL